ncbi:neprilysin-1-like [Ornithodoros turicata]|uniref:neprilysin-1-like n=1 Tax=Ornithodoros turicata TaxID=34597 RepID=UPI003138F536
MISPRTSPLPSPRRHQITKTRPGSPAPSITTRYSGEPSKDVVKKMKQLCETNDSDIRRKLRSKSRLSIWLPLFIATFIALVVIVSAYAVHRVLARTLPSILCHTADCSAHGLELKAALNKDMEPCENFYEYVCGRWQPKNEAAASVQQDMYWNTVLQYTGQLASDTSLPALLYNMCMNVTKPEEETRDAFRNFMKMLHLTWPEEPEQGILPFDVLINLAVNWNMGLWMDVHVILPKRGRPRMIHLDHQLIGVSWTQRQSEIEKQGLYEAYVKQYANLLGTSQVGSLNVTQLKADEGTILVALFWDSAIEHREATYPISRMGSVTESVPAELWLSSLNAHYHPTFNFTYDDIVYVQDIARLKAVDLILKTIPNDRLMNVIGWTFVQKHALIALLGYPEAGILKYGSAEEYQTRRVLFCFETTQMPYGLLSVSKIMGHIFLRVQRQQLDHLIQSISNSAKELITEAPWIDPTTKSSATRKLHHTLTDLWPGFDISNTSGVLLGYYRDFPALSPSFFESYLDVVKKVRTLLGHEHVDDIYLKFIFTSHGMFRYSHVTNTAHVSLQALGYPYFYHNGNPGTNYGALGSLYASQIVQAFDKEGLSFTETGEERTWWGNDSAAAYNSKLTCNIHRTSDEKSTFPLLPALAISYNAYKDELRSGTQQDVRLATLPQFSERQIFFMSYCYTLCSKSRKEQDDCNFPLMNSEMFAQAFRCPPNSTMNPANRCDFFS